MSLQHLEDNFLAYNYLTFYHASFAMAPLTSESRIMRTPINGCDNYLDARIVIRGLRKSASPNRPDYEIRTALTDHGSRLQGQEDTLITQSDDASSYFRPMLRTHGCIFCGHHVRQCSTARHYACTDRILILNDRLHLPNGQPIPNDGNGRGLKPAIDNRNMERVSVSFSFARAIQSLSRLSPTFRLFPPPTLSVFVLSLTRLLGTTSILAKPRTDARSWVDDARKPRKRGRWWSPNATCQALNCIWLVQLTHAPTTASSLASRKRNETVALSYDHLNFPADKERQVSVVEQFADAMRGDAPGGLVMEHATLSVDTALRSLECPLTKGGDAPIATAFDQTVDVENVEETKIAFVVNWKTDEDLLLTEPTNSDDVKEIIKEMGQVGGFDPERTMSPDTVCLSIRFGAQDRRIGSCQGMITLLE
ncbi:hypothetical protein EDB87DRAFT_1574608 [Lactarius vividus]|nr:hypothetical protein EDB87DRAFT_1574608 [Lactarius vividus]